MSGLKGCPPYRESNKGSKERQGPINTKWALYRGVRQYKGVRHSAALEVSVKGRVDCMIRRPLM